MEPSQTHHKMSEANETPKGWWETNWKWVIPVGCLGGIVCFAALGFGVFSLVNGMMKSSWAYTEGVKLAIHNPGIVEALGEPVEPAWWFSGSINVSGPSGDAELAIPLKGSKGRGTLYIIAHKRAGEWSFELAEVEVDGRQDRIDLLSQSPTGVSDKVLRLMVRPGTVNVV